MAVASCIVCGVNGSSGSRRAAPVAARLARDLNSRALIVHIADAGGLRDRLRLPRVGRSRQRRKMLRSIAEESCFPDGTEVYVHAGEPAEELTMVAERRDAEFIVVGASGLERGSGPFLGRASGALVRSAPCPVVVVPSAT